VLFFHTGGLLGMYDKEDQLLQLLGGNHKEYGLKVERLQVGDDQENKDHSRERLC